MIASADQVVNIIPCRLTGQSSASQSVTMQKIGATVAVNMRRGCPYHLNDCCILLSSMFICLALNGWSEYMLLIDSVIRSEVIDGSPYRYILTWLVLVSVGDYVLVALVGLLSGVFSHFVALRLDAANSGAVRCSMLEMLLLREDIKVVSINVDLCMINPQAESQLAAVH
jgi:hypothetical protein